MTPETVLRDLLAVLDRMGVAYMLTGSFASNVYGRIRSTFDADLVVALIPTQLRPLTETLGGDYYVDAGTFGEIEEAGGQFNAVHRPSGLKIDFYLARSGRDREALGRARKVALWGLQVSVITPEDLVLAKLAWAAAGGSARQVEDARGVVELQRDVLDLGYLRAKAAEMSLGEALERVLLK